MAAPKSSVTAVTEVGYCPFCRRTRNLRREERHLGSLVRTTIDCESCHRTLSTTIGPPRAEPEPEPQPAVTPEPEVVTAAAPEAATPTRKPAATKTATAKKTSTAKKK